MIKPTKIIIPIDKNVFQNYTHHDLEYIMPGIITSIFSNDDTMYEYLVQQHIHNLMRDEHTVVSYPTTEGAVIAAITVFYACIKRLTATHIALCYSPNALRQFCETHAIIDVHMENYCIHIIGEEW